MMRSVAGVLASALAILLAGAGQAKDQKPEHLYGPEPSWAEFRRLAEASITAGLIDPESARFTWLSGIHKGGFKPFLSAMVDGYVACGGVNAKNRMGGYTGTHVFLVAIDYGRVLATATDERTGGMYADMCASGLSRGLFPPPPVEASPISDGGPAEPSRAPTASATTGLALRAMPEGAYVAGVVPGSPAAMAGLKPGMVIASVNAIPLAGMGEPMLKVLDAAGAGATLVLIGGASIKLERTK